MSSAQTLSTLARFNGIVSLLAFQVTGLEPIHANVNAVRKTIGLKLISKKKGGKPTKEQVLDWVHLNVQNNANVNYEWPTKTLKSGPRKGQDILDPQCYDMADAYVMALYGCNFEQLVASQ